MLYIRSSLVIYLICSSVCVFIDPPCFPFGNHKFVLDICKSVSVL